MSDEKTPSNGESDTRDRPPLDHVPPEESPPEDDSPEPQDARSGDAATRVVEHLKSPSAWMRLLYMVLFFVLWWIARFAVIAVMLLQVLFLLFGGARNDRLATFGEGLAGYVHELVAFLTFASEKQPFPFSDWPGKNPLADKKPAD